MFNVFLINVKMGFPWKKNFLTCVTCCCEYQFAVNNVGSRLFALRRYLTVYRKCNGSWSGAALSELRVTGKWAFSHLDCEVLIRRSIGELISIYCLVGKTKIRRICQCYLTKPSLTFKYSINFLVTHFLSITLSLSGGLVA